MLVAGSVGKKMTKPLKMNGGIGHIIMCLMPLNSPSENGHTGMAGIVRVWITGTAEEKLV